MWVLTEVGQNYQQNELPERQLLVSLSTGRKSLEEVSKLPYATIAIGWARKSGWIDVNQGMVEISGKGRAALSDKSDLEKALDSVAAGDSPSQEMAKLLLSRGLIREAKELAIEAVPEKKEKKGLMSMLGFGKKKVVEEAKAEEPAPSKEIAQLTPEMIKSGAWKHVSLRKYDVTTPAPKLYPGKKQPYVQVIDSIKERLVGLGFEEVLGPLVELSFWNADALFMPQDHPGRSIHDVLMLKDPHSGRLPDPNLVAKVKATHEG